MYQYQKLQQYEGPFYSIDVECVATGTDHNSRKVAQISLVDQYENVLLNLYVKPDVPVVSYLTPLTGLTQEMLEQHGQSQATAVELLKAALPKNATLVGHGIRNDVQWLGLQEGTDFASMLDLAGLYRVRNYVHNNWTIFSQDQLAKVLLNWDVEGHSHDAVGDAIKSMRLFKLYLEFQSDAAKLQAAHQALLAAPLVPSFAKRFPQFEGVCMGNRKTCTCGGPFFT